MIRYDCIDFISGNIPVILTVPHDGKTNFLNGDLPIRRPDRINDEGTTFFSVQIFEMMEKNFSKKPFILFQRIERRRLTREFILNFYEAVLSYVDFCFKTWGRCYLLDIHAFENNPEIGQFDIILGTNHRKTILSDFDLVLGACLKSRMFFLNNSQNKLKVYIPEEKPQDGEKFCATKNFTLVKWIKDRAPQADTIQIEVYKEWLRGDDATVKLSQVFSTTIYMVTNI